MRHCRPTLSSEIFITCDVVATVIQIIDSALIGVAYSNYKNPNTPNHILLAGLAFQVFSFAVFVVSLSLCLGKSRQVTSAAFSRKLTCQSGCALTPSVESASKA